MPVYICVLRQLHGNAITLAKKIQLFSSLCVCVCIGV